MTILPGELRFIVLMLENRSFDHLLGYMPNIGGLTGNESNFANGENGEKICVSNQAEYTIDPGPDHSHKGVRTQLFGDYKNYDGMMPSMSGFVKNYGEIDFDKKHNIMKCFDPEKIPVIAELVRSYRVCSRWFSSVPGQTWPNRNFAHAGTSHGEVNIRAKPYTDKTIFEQLHKADRTWAIYHDGFAQTWVFPELPVLGGGGFRSMRNFYNDVEKDRLPDYSFIEPQYFGSGSDCMHPGRSYVGNDEWRFRAGERLIASVYNALSHNDAVWKKTVLLITFDEHGGFYDHVAPPSSQTIPPAIPPDNEVWRDHDGHEFKFDLLGVRVPTIIVSPWVEPGTVDDRTYDHTSIIATARRFFAPHVGELHNRDKVAPDLLDSLTELTPRKRIELPSVPLPPPSVTPDSDDLMPEAELQLDEFQESLIWLGEAVDRAIKTPGMSLSTSLTITPATPLRSFNTLAELDAFQNDVVARFRQRYCKD